MSYQETVLPVTKSRRKASQVDQLFCTVLQPFQWKCDDGSEHTVVYLPQFSDYKSQDSIRHFCLPADRLVFVSDRAKEVFDMKLIAECISRLNTLAKVHNGLKMRQFFDVYPSQQQLWIMDEGDNGPITIGVRQRFNQPIDPIPRIVQDWVDAWRQQKGEPGEARVLDIVKRKGSYYFIDDRLKELRNVEDFMDTIKFASSGELMHFRRNECLQVT